MTAEVRYRLKPALLVLDDGSSLQIGFSPKCGFRLESPSVAMRALVVALRTGGTDRELVEAAQHSEPGAPESAVREWLVELLASGLVEDVTREDADAFRLPEHLVARQEHTLALLSLLTRPHTPSAHAWLSRLATTRIVMLGVGGVGCHVALSLVAAGCRRLFLLDSDRVSDNNLNRQILYRTTDIGRWKVEAAAEALMRLDPGCRLETAIQRVERPEDLASTLPEDTGFLVCAADEPYGHIYRWVNGWACSRGVPWAAANFVETLATVGPLVVPGKTACWNCIESMMAREGGDPFRIITQMHHDQMQFQVNPSLAPFVALASSLLALDVVKTVTGMAVPTTWSRSVSFDVSDLTPRSIDWERETDCPVCGSIPVLQLGE